MSDIPRVCGCGKPIRYMVEKGEFSCNKIFRCMSYEQAIERIRKYHIALADAIRSPMGVCPDSAAGLLTNQDLDAAEERRTKGRGNG